MYSKFILLWFSLFITLVTSFLLACTAQKDDNITTAEELQGVISSYTSSVIPSDGELMVRFTDQVDEEIRTHNKTIFGISPSVRGTQRWTDSHTVIFTPQEPLSNGKQYRVSFDIASVHPAFSGKAPFTFDVEVMPQDLEARLDPLSPDPDSPTELQVLRGRVMTADAAQLSDIRRSLEVRHDGYQLTPEWTQENATHFAFEISGIQRGESTTRLEVKWDGRHAGAPDARGQRQISISPLSEFALIGVEVIYGANPHIQLAFSEMIDDSQNLRGLISINGLGDPGFVVQNNIIRVFPPAAEPASRELNISEGIRSAQGTRLGVQTSRTVELGNRNPEVRLLGSGVILPDSDKLLLPFEAVNLGAVDVQVMRIFENNVPQFMQNQRLGDTWGGMREVGRPVAQEVVALSRIGDVEVGKWNSYALDLSSIMKPEPGAIYRVSIGFRQHQSLYPCEERSAPVTRTEWTQDEATETSYWANYGSFYVPGGYNWRDRDDPCTPSYYLPSSVQQHRNMFASELGLIAKRDSKNGVSVFVTDLNSARPVSNVELEVMDFQQQMLGSGRSNSDGYWSLTNLDHDPHLLIAKRGEERGYLRLDDATSLSLSEFDVSGLRIEEGVKGFMYAERDVWRPGDSLFVNLMIEADESMLPKDHPATFELIDPSGRVADRRVVRPLDRLYSFPTRTRSDAVTGRWSVVARIGGNAFRHNVNIETIRPNRLRVALEPDEAPIVGARATLSGTINAEWLHGATASGLDVDITMNLREGRLSFSDYPQFSFNDPSRTLETNPEVIFEGQLSDEGEVDFSHTLERPEGAPGLILAGLTTRVFEESGAFSTNRSQVRYLPYERFTGVNITELSSERPILEQDGDNQIEAVLLDTDGNALSNQVLTVEIFELQWSWWWQRQNENLSQYFERSNRRPVFQEQVITGRNGKASLNIPYASLDWGRYLVRVVDSSGDGHASGEIVFVGWTRSTTTRTGGPHRLVVETDKETYQPGETITLTFPGSAQGRALVSLENGTEILESFWVNTEPGQTEVRIPVTSEMSPNIYASVHFIQPHAQVDNDLPVRLYGIVPVMVEDPQTRLQPVAQMPEEIRPESQASIRVSEANGRGMTYTIAIVDEGLLDITNFRTPDPHSRFYAREALGVRSWDMYDDVAGTYAGSLNRILAIGGDMDLELDEDPDDITRFVPMVRFLGPFRLEAGQTAAHDFDVPNYVGSVRTMVIVGDNGAYGHAETRTPVRQPVMVQATLPRVLGPGETVTLPVTVFAMRDEIKTVDVTIEFNEMFSANEPLTQTATFSRTGDQTIRFTLDVAEQTGAGNVRITAVSGDERARDEINIEIRNPVPPFVQVYDHQLAAGEIWTFSYDPVGMEGTNSAALELSGIPPIDLSRRMNELMRYPHGCLEQRTSAVFPQLYLHRFTDLTEEEEEAIQNRINSYIAELERFRHPSFGLTYWPGEDGTYSWATIYALHFMVEAEKAGYYVPSSLIRHVADNQRRAASDWRNEGSGDHSRSDLVQAYRLYALSLYGNPPLSAMNRMRESSGLSMQARWRLAAAYQIAGMPEAASQLVSRVGTEIEEYRELSHTFGSRMRDQAMILETLSTMGRSGDAVQLMRDLANQLSSNDWLSTQETAYALIAISAFIEDSGASEEMDVRYSLSSLGDGSVQGRQPYSLLEYDIPGTSSQNAEIVNRGDGTLFIRLIQEGTPLIDQSEAVSSNLVQQVRYIYDDGEEVDPSSLRQGTDIIAEVQVYNPGTRGDYDEVALSQIFPSGWEIANTRLDDITFGEQTSTATHTDIRDDRVLTYFNLRAGETRTFRTRVTATYEGRFYLPAVSSYTMYDNTINARTPGQWVEVHR